MCRGALADLSREVLGEKKSLTEIYWEIFVMMNDNKCLKETVTLFKKTAVQSRPTLSVDPFYKIQHSLYMVCLRLILIPHQD